MEKRDYEADREYSVWEILRENLRVWWLILLCALAGALLLGGYKYLSNRSYVSDEKYEEVHQVTASLCVKEYSSESAAERVGTLIKTADSRSAYEKLLENTGYDLEYLGYQQLFDLLEGESSDIVTVYVKYPNEYGAFAIENEYDALAFAQNVIDAVDRTMEELMGTSCLKVLDAPYVADAAQKALAYAPSRQELAREVAKAAAAGVLFGVIVEVAVYTGIQTLRRKRAE